MGLTTSLTGPKVLHSTRLRGLLLALAYLALAIIHWRHSWWKLSHGQIFADLGDSRDSNPLNEILQALTLAGIFGVYLDGLVKWERREFSLREVSLIGIAPLILAWGALPANSTDLLACIGLGRITAIYGSNPYIHTYSEFDDFYSPFVQWDITMPYGPVVLPFFILAGKISQSSVMGAVFLLKFIWRLWRIRDLSTLVNELIIIFLALLIGYTAWFFPWYVAWLVPLAALTDSLKLRWTVIAFSGTSLALYAFPNFVVEQAPLHWLWASLRIAIVHLVPLILPALAYRFERQD